MAAVDEGQVHVMSEPVAASLPVAGTGAVETLIAHQNGGAEAAEPLSAAPQHAMPVDFLDFESLPSLSVDSYDDGTDSALGGSSLSSSTASMTSSAYEFVEESGRRFHKFKAGRYQLPNDELEQDRLDLQHQMFQMTLGGLYLAPIKQLEGGLHNVLDIGTGTGTWALEFADEFPSANVLGVDLSPIQPQYLVKISACKLLANNSSVSPNCRFQVDDVEDPWVYSHKFDYIHGRALVTCFKSHLKVFGSAYEFLRPGGYFEMQDIEAPMHYLDNSFHGTRLEVWRDIVLEAVKKLGKDFRQAQRYKTYFEQAGFVDVTEKIIPVPIGSWAKGARLKKIGTWFREDICSALEGMSIGLLIKVLGLSKEAVDNLVADVKADFHNPRIHCFANVRIVVGRKAL